MGLPALTLREKILYKDTATAYVAVNASTGNPVLNSDAGNNISSWTVAPVSATDPTPLSNFPCNLHLTGNFDLVRSPAGLAKEVNIDTSNLLTCQRAIDLQAAMRIHATTRYGDSYWYKVQGAAEMEVLVPCTCVYMVPDDDPDVIT
jgi:hypothetical protein